MSVFKENENTLNSLCDAEKEFNEIRESIMRIVTDKILTNCKMRLAIADCCDDLKSEISNLSDYTSAIYANLESYRDKVNMDDKEVYIFNKQDFKYFIQDLNVDVSYQLYQHLNIKYL